MILNKWKLVKVGFILEVLIYHHLHGKFPVPQYLVIFNLELKFADDQGE